MDPIDRKKSWQRVNEEGKNNATRISWACTLSHENGDDIDKDGDDKENGNIISYNINNTKEHQHQQQFTTAGLHLPFGSTLNMYKVWRKRFFLAMADSQRQEGKILKWLLTILLTLPPKFNAINMSTFSFNIYGQI